MNEKTLDVTRRRGVPLPERVKEIAKSMTVVDRAWTRVRTEQVHAEYRRRREHYAGIASERGIVYREEDVIASIRARLAKRGHTPTRRVRGEIHTFACIPMLGWHAHLLPDLRELGTLTLFDYESLDFHYADFIRHDAKSIELRDAMSARLLDTLRATHAERPVDWVFFYGGGQDIVPATVRAITEELGIPVANMSLDDKQGWAGESAAPWRTGAVDITKEFDLYATSARVACEWHLVEGGRPIYMPEGFDASAYAPREVKRDIDVSFLGNAYGFRRALVRELEEHGVRVTTFGSGWSGAGWAKDPVDVFNRSRINLGMGGIEYSESLTNVKGRDFEVPGTGGGMYLTTFNPDLALHFHVGEEIVCYRNRDELVELIRWYLAHPDEADAIAERGRARSLREHRWLHRYEKMLRAFGVLDA
ncbi:MAG TPA: glycosyltransferase [Thermoanaerobaculia bacterium]|nr:glycosyltransferase [Thermoanaerobaculia bacterium]